MIATHNTFTYLDCKNIFINLLKPFWRCQTKTIAEQYCDGVRYFDIRVKHKFNKHKESYWQICHGIANVDISFQNAKILSDYLKTNFPKAIYRVILESYKNENDIDLFTEEFLSIQDDNLVAIIIKHPWEIIYWSNTQPANIIDLCVKLFHWDQERSFWYNIKHFDFASISIKKWAQSHNPIKITKEMINDKNNLYFLDYYHLTIDK